MMKKIMSALLIMTSFAFSTLAVAHDYTQAHMRIDHPWSRLAAPNSKVIAGYFQLKNNSTKDDYLISASTPIADKAEIHMHAMQDGMMIMKKINKVKIGSMKTKNFEPGGLHLMIFNPKYLPKKGERFPLELNFKYAGKITVDVAVEMQGHVHDHH